MEISRYIQNEEDIWGKIPKEFYISENEWQEEIRKNARLILLSDFDGFEPMQRFLNVAVVVSLDGNKLSRIRLVHGRLIATYDNSSYELIVALAEIANNLKAYMLVSHCREYPKYKVLAAEKRLMQKSKNEFIEYQKESFGYSLWFAIKGDLTQVLDYFQLEGQEKAWDKALEDMQACEGIFAYYFRGWTFLAGMNAGELLAPYPEGEMAIEQHHVTKLLEWGKTFIDVQMYYFYDRVEYVSAYYRVYNEQVVYGSYYSESYQNTHKKAPAVIKNLLDETPSMVASEWSFNPDYLRYCKELKDAKAWIVKLRKE